MRTASSSSCPGGFSWTRPLQDQTPPGIKHPPGADPTPPWEQTSPGADTPPTSSEQAPPGSRPPPWTEFLTHASENITLPQASFAGGNNAIQ